MHCLRIIAASLFCTLALSFPAPGTAQSSGESTQSSTEAKVERSQEYLTELTQKSANIIDNFFSSERHSWGGNKTRVTLRGNVDYLDKHGWEFDPEVRINLKLPGVSDRVRIIMNEDDDDGGTSGGSSDEDESTLGLRFIGKLNENYGISGDLGISSRGDPTIQGFARLNMFVHYNLGRTTGWVGRTENRLYYYSDSRWRNDFRQYFEREFFGKFFFRSRTRLDYQEDKDSDTYPEQKFSVFHKINPKTIVAYEAIYRQIFFDDSPFDVDEILNPQERFDRYALQLRFRRNFKYPWLFYEVWPGLGWAEERDYDLTPFVRFRIEVVLGDPPKEVRLDE